MDRRENTVQRNCCSNWKYCNFYQSTTSFLKYVINSQRCWCPDFLISFWAPQWSPPSSHSLVGETESSCPETTQTETMLTAVYTLLPTDQRSPIIDHTTQIVTSPGTVTCGPRTRTSRGTWSLLPVFAETISSKLSSPNRPSAISVVWDS